MVLSSLPYLFFLWLEVLFTCYLFSLLIWMLRWTYTGCSDVATFHLLIHSLRLFRLTCIFSFEWMPSWWYWYIVSHRAWMMEHQKLEMLLFRPWQLWPRYLFLGFFSLFVELLTQLSHWPLLLCFSFFIKSVGMRPLEKSLEKLDDVRKKKLSEMIGGSGGDPASTSSSGLKFFFLLLKVFHSICCTIICLLLSWLS